MKLNAGPHRLAMMLLTIVLTASCKRTSEQTQPAPARQKASSKGAHRDSVTVGVYRPTLSAFLLRNNNSSGKAEVSLTYGVEGDISLAGDWNGDGTATIGVYRTSLFAFLLRNTNSSGNQDVSITYGVKGDIPVVGDWDGSDQVDSELSVE